MNDAHRWFDRADELADRGGHQEEAEQFLRDAVAVGPSASTGRLAEFLWLQSGRDRQDVVAEVEQLLSRAVDEGVPGAANAFGNVLADTGQDGPRRTDVPAGDR